MMKIEKKDSEEQLMKSKDTTGVQSKLVKDHMDLKDPSTNISKSNMLKSMKK